MPSREALRMLVRDKPISLEEWFVLLEFRRAAMKPYLNRFTLPELGGLECLQNEGFQHGIGVDCPQVIGDRQFGSKLQGIFLVQPFEMVDRIPKTDFPVSMGYGSACCPQDGTMRLWGMTRAGQWVLITIEFVGEEGYKGRGYERARVVTIVEMSLANIMEMTKDKPERLWYKLGEIITDWSANLWARYREIYALAQEVTCEEAALRLCVLKANPNSSEE